MSHLINMIPFPALAIIMGLISVTILYYLLKYRRQLGAVGFGGLFFAFFLMPLSSLLLKAIRTYHFLKSFEKAIFVFDLVFLFSGLFLLLFKVYNEKVKYNAKYKKLFWGYVIVMVLLIAFTVFAIHMANISR